MKYLPKEVFHCLIMPGITTLVTSGGVGERIKAVTDAHTSGPNYKSNCTVGIKYCPFTKKVNLLNNRDCLVVNFNIFFLKKTLFYSLSEL